MMKSKLFRKTNVNPRLLPMALGFWLVLYNQTPVYSRSDTTSFEKGLVIDTVLCKEHPGFSYALYLPNNYTEAKKWPIIYIFDPGARGSLAVNIFKQAAERYGYILTCSNNSKNGDWDKIVEAANNMFEDVEGRFSLDNKRTYTSGFSGGSRVAAYVAQTTNNIAGVIGCGAGFPSTDEGRFTESISYDYVGIVGDKDMNYFEMFQFEQKLNSIGITVNLRTFDAGHQWPSPLLIQDAVEWLELQAMKKGTRSKVDSFILAQFKKSGEQVKWFENHGDLFETARYYRYIIRDFPDQPDISWYQKKLDSLEKSKDYKKAVKKWNKIKLEEQDATNIFVTSLYNIINAGSLPDSVCYWWKEKIKALKTMESSHNKNEQCMASRLLKMLNSICYENGRNYMTTKQYSMAVILYQLVTIVQPEEMYAYYSLSRALAFNKESKRSLHALEKAIELGLKNKQMLQNDSAFAWLKDDKRYQMLISKMQ